MSTISSQPDILHGLEEYANKVSLAIVLNDLYKFIIDMCHTDNNLCSLIHVHNMV